MCGEIFRDKIPQVGSTVCCILKHLEIERKINVI